MKGQEIQPTLFEIRRTRLQREFDCFDSENPEVWRLFVRFADQAIAAGRAHYSARDIIHRIRWHLTVETKNDDGFKINNNHSPYYARKLVRLRPQLDGFFEMRHAEGDPELR